MERIKEQAKRCGRRGEKIEEKQGSRIERKKVGRNVR